MSRPGIAQKRFSLNRFRQIPKAIPESENPMAAPNDVTIDIPLRDSSDHANEREESQEPQPLNHQRRGGETEGSRKSDSISFYQYRSSREGDTGNNLNEKAHLVPDCEQESVGRRKRHRNKKTRRGIDGQGADAGGGEGEGEGEGLTRLGHVYKAIVSSSIVLRYLIYIAPLALLIAIPIIVGATVAQHATIGSVRVYWFFAWIEVIWLSLWVSKLVAKGLPSLFQCLCGIVSPGTRKYALMLRTLEIPISLVWWTVISLVTFFPMMLYNPEQKSRGETNPKSWEKSVKNILFALFVCSLIFLAEKTSVLFISIGYHRKQFDSKIKESKRSVHLLSLLYEASRAMFPMYCKEFHEEDVVICDSLLAAATSPNGSLLRGRGGVIRNVGQNVGRLGDKVTEAFGNVAQELTGKQVFNPTAAHSIVTQALERTKSSEALARRIWMSFVIEGREALYLEDMAEVLGNGRDQEAEESFQMLDRDDNGDISLDEMLLTVTELGRIRKSLHHSLHDVDQAIHVLDQLLFSVAAIVGVLVFVSFVTTGFGTVIAAGATSLLSLSFVFSTTAQEVLGSCIFIFVKHPFDVGDRVDINGRSFAVERISLLFSVFRSVTDHRITQVPNAILNTLWIDNLTRAKAMHEQLTVNVNFDTTFAHIQSLREEMEIFVRDKDNCRDFQPEIDIEVFGMGDDMDRLQLHVDIRHKSNWSNESVHAARRSKFMCALVLAMRRLHIRGPGDESIAAAPAAEESMSVAQSGSNSDHNSSHTSDKRTSNSSSTNLKSTQAQGQPTAHLMVPDNINPTGGRSTSFDDTNQRGTYPYFPTTSTGGSLHRRRSATQRAAPSEDGPEADDNYQTPDTSPQRNRQSLRYSTSINTRTEQALVRGASTGHRNRNSHMHPYQQYQYHPYPGIATTTDTLDPGASQHYVPSSAERSEYYPYSSAEQRSQSSYNDSTSTAYDCDSRKQSHEQGQGEGQGEGQGHVQQQPHWDEELEHGQPLELPSGLESSGPESEPGHEQQQKQQQQPHRFVGLEQVPEHELEHEQEIDVEPVSPFLPPSPAGRSSRAGSEEQGIGKPRGPRSQGS